MVNADLSNVLVCLKSREAETNVEINIGLNEVSVTLPVPGRMISFQFVLVGSEVMLVERADTGDPNDTGNRSTVRSLHNYANDKEDKEGMES
jgi:hypothetical protein